MKNTRKYCFVFILALAVFIFWGCATTQNKGIKEGDIVASPRIAYNADDVGQRIQDANISSALKMRFADDKLVSASNINVDTSHRNITLNGKVGSQAQADRAMLLGRSIDGVRSVHSNLIVE